MKKTQRWQLVGIIPFLLSAVFILALPGRADAILPMINADAFYLSDSFTYSSSSTTVGRTFWDIMVGLPLTAKDRIVLGWNYGSYSFSDNPGTAKSLTVSDMGPELFLFVDNDRLWGVEFAYGLVTSASYNSGSTTTTLKGSSLRAGLSRVVPITETFLLGAKLTYYQVSLNEEVTGGTTLATVSDSRTLIYPSFTFTFRFE